MKTFKKIAFILLFLKLSIVHATHIPGLNLSYQCIGPNTYIITLTLFEDCGQAFISNTSELITISDDCGYNIGDVSLPIMTYQQEVSQLCPTDLNSSECNGGSLPGIYMHVWTDTIVLPGTCDSWTFSYQNCCRNNSDNTTGGVGNSQYIETVLNNTIEPCNNSPYVTNQLIPYVCVNQPLTYNLGVVDPDGDSLVFSLMTPMQTVNILVPFAPGFTSNQPLPGGITIDPTTGDLQINPNITGNFVLAVLVEEYNSNGILIGSFIHDFQFEVINCATNNNPVEPSGVSNFNGTANLTGSNQVTMCPGESFCFEIVFTDANAGDSIYISSNLSNVLPSATFNQLTYESPASAEVCYTFNGSLSSFTNITFTARDNFCPIYGISFYSVNIVFNSVYIEAVSDTMCYGDSVQLSASGDPNLTWTVLSGDPISIGNNFSCNNCIDPIASPDSTTVYIATSFLNGLCVNTDTIEVVVVPEFQHSILQNTNVACVMEEVYLFANLQPDTISYSFDWSPGNNLNDSTIMNPIATISTNGTVEYIVEIRSEFGCIKYDTATIFVNPSMQPSISTLFADTTILCNNSIDLVAEIDSSFNSSPFYDDFDPTINATIWGSLNEANPGTGCGSFSGSNALHFAGNSGERWAETIGLNTNSCTLIEFCLFLGNDLSNIPCENADFGDEVELQYSIDGGLTWITIQTYLDSWWDAGGQFENSWNCFSVPIPAGAISINTIFRWHQLPTPGGATVTGFDNWSIDNVQITCTSYENYIYNWIPTNNITLPDTLITSFIASSSGLYDYNVIVIDTVSGCSDTSSIKVNVFCCSDPIININNVSCFGLNDGSIEVIPQGDSLLPPWSVDLIDLNSGIIFTNNFNKYSICYF